MSILYSIGRHYHLYDQIDWIEGRHDTPSHHRPFAREDRLTGRWIPCEHTRFSNGNTLGDMTEIYSIHSSQAHAVLLTVGIWSASCFGRLPLEVRRQLPIWNIQFIEQVFLWRNPRGHTRLFRWKLLRKHTQISIHPSQAHSMRSSQAHSISFQALAHSISHTEVYTI